MRSITERTNKDGAVRHQVIVRVPGNPSVTKTFETRKGAEKWAEDTARAISVQSPLTARRKCFTLEDFEDETLAHTINLFLKSKSVRRRNGKDAPTVLRNIGRVKNADLTELWVINFIAHMREQKTMIGNQFTWATIKDHISLINKARRWRCRQETLICARIPFDIREMFPRNWDNKRSRRFKPGEERALRTRLARIRHRSSRRFWLLLVSFALETAARQQELLFATWDNVELEACRWEIPSNHSKTGVGRVVPLSQRSMRILRILWQLRHPTSKRIFHELGNPPSVSALFRRYSRDAGLVDYKFHDLRHDAICNLVIHKRKLSVFEIMAMVGHSGTEMLMRYSNFRTEELVERLN